MRKIDRFDKYMDFKKLNDNKVTVQLGLTVGVIGKSRNNGRDLSDNSIEQILNFYTDLNKVWLLTGEGEMLKSEKNIQNNSENNHGVNMQAGGNIENSTINATPKDFIDIIKKKDEQIDRLLSLLENVK